MKFIDTIEIITLEEDITLNLIVDYDRLTGESAGYSVMLRETEVTWDIKGELEQLIEAEVEAIVASRKYGIE